MLEQLKKVQDALYIAWPDDEKVEICTKLKEALATLDTLIQRLESEELVEEVAKAVFPLVSGDPEDDHENKFVQDVAKAAINVILNKGE